MNSWESLLAPTSLARDRGSRILQNILIFDSPLVRFLFPMGASQLPIIQLPSPSLALGSSSSCFAWPPTWQHPEVCRVCGWLKVHKDALVARHGTQGSSGISARVSSNPNRTFYSKREIPPRHLGIC